MTPAFHRAGNTRPHIVAAGYQDRSRHSGPLHSTPENSQRIWFVGFVIAALLVGLVGWFV